MQESDARTPPRNQSNRQRVEIQRCARGMSAARGQRIRRARTDRPEQSPDAIRGASLHLGGTSPGTSARTRNSELPHQRAHSYTKNTKLPRVRPASARQNPRSAPISAICALLISFLASTLTPDAVYGTACRPEAIKSRVPPTISSATPPTADQPPHPRPTNHRTRTQPATPPTPDQPSHQHPTRAPVADASHLADKCGDRGARRGILGA